jgi:pimeloyl-ACP methyl ester carboxylesterase
VIDGMTKAIKDAALHEKIKTLMLKTRQHVAVSEFEATADEDLWKEDKIEVLMLLVLAKQPAWSPEYEQFVRKLAPKVDYQVWENVSHFLMMERPREFNALLWYFWKRTGFSISNLAARRPQMHSLRLVPPAVKLASANAF